MEFNLENIYFTDLEERMPIADEHLKTKDVKVIKDYLSTW